MELVGREAELTDVLDRLHRRRLVTITGAGGIGKTTLAQAVLGRLNGEPFVVDLTRIDDPRGVEGAIAGQLGHQDIDNLVDGCMLAEQVCLVDNCEHVLDAAAWAIGQMLERVPDLTILATSRTPLDLPGESVVPLGPLDGGDPDRPDSLALFLAAVVDSGGSVESIDLEVAAEICRRLDGVPLALEIAAGRLRTMAPAELLASIDTDLGSLARPRFRGRSSHQGVAAMVAGSIQLLDLPTRDVFDALGVFAGSFSVDAAAAVTASTVEEVRLALDEMAAASLLIVDTGTRRTRFRMLHPVRAVAVDRLRAAGRFDVAQERFVDHTVAESVQTVLRAHAGWDGAVLADLLAEYEHLVAAARWVIDRDENPARAFILLTVLWGVIHQAHAAEVETLGSRALAKWPDVEAPGHADVVATVVTCRVVLGAGEEVEPLLRETLARVEDGTLAACTLRRALAQSYRRGGMMEQSRDLFREAAEVAEQLGAGGLAMESWVGQGMISAELGDVDGGLAAIEKAGRRAQEAGAGLNAVWAETCRAAVLLFRSPDAAHAAAEEALAAARDMGYPIGVTAALRVLAMAHLAQGRDAAAAARLLEMIEDLRRRGGLGDLRMALDLVATVGERHGVERWEDLAVTAAALPVTTIFALGDQGVLERARPRGRVLSLRESQALAREMLTDLTADRPCENAEVLLRDMGDSWTIRHRARDFSVRASKGMTDLARLLSAPGVEFSALDLMGAVVTVEGADQVLDESARRAYTARVRELQSEIDDATEFGDLAAAERHRGEMDAIVSQLTAATGLGGRRRRTPTAAERARSAVTHRLRSTISRITELDSDLGQHLAASITTGAFCSYRPGSGFSWTVEASPR